MTRSSARVAFINLKLMPVQNRHQSREVDTLLNAFEDILELLPRLSLLGSTRIRSAAQVQIDRILAAVKWAGDPGMDDPDDGDTAFEYVLWVPGKTSVSARRPATSRASSGRWAGPSEVACSKRSMRCICCS